MSFCDKAKEEALDVTQRKCCRDAQFCGFSCAFLRRRDSGLRGIIRNKHIADYFEKSCLALFGIGPEKEGSYTYVLSEDLGKRIENMCGGSLNNPCLKLKDCCKTAFLRGVFLGCGRITEPMKAYDLEFEIKDEQFFLIIKNMLCDLGYPPKTAKRNTSLILYYKVSEQIEDLLNILGMTFAALETINVQMEKQVRNDINRRNNFDIANTGKVTSAAVDQKRMVEGLIASGRFSLMPPELKTLAYLRLNNPTVSLAELGQLCDPPIGKSAIKRRFDKIAEYCEKEERK